ncbi:MAG: hypothetical protein NTZ60_08355 [Campylobacterales bacterium]|nr:hypothetical protein [Campylobacterales bacterium]
MNKIISFGVLVASIFTGCSTVRSEKVSPTVVQTVVVQAEKKAEKSNSSRGEYVPTWHGGYYMNGCSNNY